MGSSTSLGRRKGASVTFTSDVLSLEIDGPVATLWLNRPEARNALGRDFWRDLPRAAAVLEEDRRVRVVVLAARGRDFTVGLDLKELGGALGGEGRDAPSKASANHATYRAVREMQDAVSSLANLRTPVLAAVHGYCLGGGIDLVTACDVRLATTTSVFSVRETKVAIVADLGTLQRLPRVIGAGHVAELAYTGKDISGERAAAIGLVNHAVGETPEEVLEATYALAREIAANSPLAVEGTKAVLRANDGATIDEGLEFVARWNTMFLASNDLREAMTAFLERRAPKFTGD
ncbi:MAG: crotonase/enoyl-CoA hydratase family protein [Acidobacteriota bacterium]|nr:crotonase/enoyl-CoA hydratase family protein [Acidobacteriota bacterium]